MGILNEIRGMLLVVVFACIIVFLAMIIDLISGLQKAKQRGEVRTSYGLSRSLSKFIMYEGGMMIGAGIDCLIHFSKLLHLFGLESINDVPMITCLIGVFLLVTEFLSVREKADEKTKKNLKNTVEILAQFLTKEEIKAILLKRLEQEEINNDRP